MVKSDKHGAREGLSSNSAKWPRSKCVSRSSSTRSGQAGNEKIKARHEEKQSTLDAVKKWRKTAADCRGLMDDEDGFEQVLHAKPDRALRTGKRDLAQKGKKRQAKDAKFGFGGKKRFAKRNNADSYSKDGQLGLRAPARTWGAQEGQEGARPAKARTDAQLGESRGESKEEGGGA